ncbi:hypothetical protein KL86PLE_40245 [uncultured Pleomorphomonas sp.]|uniref:Uncharacterized protein n=1 Tax=uncultured Pleomorphomonas sp. TaxID=442121 RepID=A0A212LG39_9HYPH|nr:hypothetical protein KL86PLE_40245 [uncultured Pleomorphomonas sp.]
MLCLAAGRCAGISDYRQSGDGGAKEGKAIAFHRCHLVSAGTSLFRGQIVNPIAERGSRHDFPTFVIRRQVKYCKTAQMIAAFALTTPYLT